MYFTLNRNCPKPPVILFNNNTLQYVDTFKLLGCHIAYDLKWNTHIDSILLHISKGVAMLACTKQYFPVSVKRLIYFAYINSHLLYCISIWGNAALYLLNKLLVMQKKAIRLIVNTHYLAHVKPIALELNILLLPDLYAYLCAINMYKVVNNLNALSTLKCFVRCVSVHNTSRSQYRLYHPNVRTVVRQNSVVINSISIWNNLAPKIALERTLALFKRAMFAMLTKEYTM
jgi:hypothetical protein